MKGLIHIYCGDGKGKTTSSLGLVLRACGNDFNVIFAQFLKTQITGELTSLNSLKNVQVLRGNLPEKFSWNYTEEDKKNATNTHDLLFQEAISLIKDENPTLLVLDEIVGAIANNLINVEMVLNFLKEKPSNLEVVLTGRNPIPELIEIADYVSEIKKIKHPFDEGVPARKGIEY